MSRSSRGLPKPRDRPTGEATDAPRPILSGHSPLRNSRPNYDRTVRRTARTSNPTYNRAIRNVSRTASKWESPPSR